MKIQSLAALAVATVLIASSNVFADDTEEGFKSLMDGKTFEGWKSALDSPDTWKIEDGAFVAHGKMDHLYYVGDPTPFKNFVLRVDVMTETNSNGGIYFHTKYQENSWPKQGFESQVNVSHGDWKKTGSLYDVVNVGWTPAQDYKWWTQEITVKGNKVTVKIDGKTVLEYNEPPGAQPRPDYTRKIGEGTFALQAHDPKSIVRYKNIRVKRLD